MATIKRNMEIREITEGFIVSFYDQIHYMREEHACADLKAVADLVTAEFSKPAPEMPQPGNGLLAPGLTGQASTTSAG